MMTNNTELVKKLTSETNELEAKIKNRKRYNCRNFVIRLLIKCGIGIDYALPFILTSIITFYCFGAKGNLPFKKDQVLDRPSIETVDTSSGVHKQYFSYDYKYDGEEFEYSTGWIMNDRGLYQRTVTTYRVDKSIDLSDTEKIFNMTKEEIENSLVITNIKTIQKNTLEPEDSLYDEDAFIITNHTLTEEGAIQRQETTGENVLNSLLYLVISIACGFGVTFAKKIIFKNYIKDKLKGYQKSFKSITPEDFEELKKIYDIKHKNLEMITPSSNQEDDGYSFRLRKA